MTSPTPHQAVNYPPILRARVCQFPPFNLQCDTSQLLRIAACATEHARPHRGEHLACRVCRAACRVYSIRLTYQELETALICGVSWRGKAVSVSGPEAGL